MSVTINAAVCSNVGRVRTNNEDNFFMNGLFMNETNRDQGGTFAHSFSHNRMVFAVCDGMGGTARGEDASFCAVKKLNTFLTGNQEVGNPAILRPVIQDISDAVEDECRGSGTTIVMVSVQGERACISHVGDSRVYTMQNGVLSRATVDHSEVQRLYSMGLITREQMATHPKRNMINQFLGMPRSEAMVAPGFTDGIKLVNGMRFMLCSDGLTDMVDDATIQEIMAEGRNPGDTCNALVRKALENGGKDNVTVMCLEVNGAEESKDAYESTVVTAARNGKQEKHAATGSKTEAIAKFKLIRNISAAAMAVGAIGMIAGIVMIFIQ